MRRPALRVLLTIVLLVIAALMCWLAQPALAPPAPDATPGPTDEPPASTGDASARTLATYITYHAASLTARPVYV